MKRIENIRSDINTIIDIQSLNLNQINVLNTLFMVNEIFTREIESVELTKEGNFEVQILSRLLITFISIKSWK